MAATRTLLNIAWSLQRAEHGEQPFWTIVALGCVLGQIGLPGGGFGLASNAMSASDTRSELGTRFDSLALVDQMPLILRGRVAWAHDWVSNPAIGAAFQALPGSAFTVNGAAPPKK